MPPTVDINIKASEFSRNACESWMGSDENSAFCDITLVSEDGHKVKAHKIILANSSSVFRSILMNNVNPVPLIYLRGVKFCSLSPILDFIYQGETNIKQENLQQFLDIAEDLKLEGVNPKEETHDILQNNPNTCSDFSNIDSKLFNLLNDKEISYVEAESKLVKFKETNNSLENTPTSEFYSCSMTPTDVDDQVLAMIEKQKQTTKLKTGRLVKNYKCNVCNFMCRNKQDCMKHVERHIEGLSYTCLLCNHKTKTKNTMKVHIAQHKQLSQVSYSESEITSDFSNETKEDSEPFTKQNSSDNLHRDDTEELEPYTCSMDTSEVEAKSLTMIAKVENIGSHGRMYKCNVCSLVSRDKTDCIKHVETHIAELSYTCVQCEHNTKTKNSIEVHVLKHERIASKSIEYISDVMSLANVSKEKLEEQISSMIERGEKHSNGKQRGNKWVCTVCGKISMQRNHSSDHVETHLEGLLFSCPHCSYTGKTRVSIRSHLKFAH